MSNIRNIEFVGVYDIQMQIIERVELLQEGKNKDELYLREISLTNTLVNDNELSFFDCFMQ